MDENNRINYEFNWKFGEFEIRTTHRTLGNDEPYIELIKWYEDDRGRRLCFTLAYFYIAKDGCPELHFVGDRPFREIADIDIGKIWKQLWYAQEMLQDAERKIDAEKWNNY